MNVVVDAGRHSYVSMVFSPVPLHGKKETGSVQKKVDFSFVSSKNQSSVVLKNSKSHEIKLLLAILACWGRGP